MAKPIIMTISSDESEVIMRGLNFAVREGLGDNGIDTRGIADDQLVEMYEVKALMILKVKDKRMRDDYRDRHAQLLRHTAGKAIAALTPFAGQPIRAAGRE